jgi:hypothetical protein
MQSLELESPNHRGQLFKRGAKLFSLFGEQLTDQRGIECDSDRFSLRVSDDQESFFSRQDVSDTSGSDRVTRVNRSTSSVVSNTGTSGRSVSDCRKADWKTTHVPASWKSV